MLALTLAALSLGADPQFDVKPGFVVRSASPSPGRGEGASDPADSAVQVFWRFSGGSGVCVACEGGRSLVLTNAHVCERAGEWVRVRHRGKTHKGFVAYTERNGADLAAVVVYAEVPPLPVADAEPAPGAEVRQYGFPARAQGRLVPKVGRLLGYRGSREASGAAVVESTHASESGDSGSGVVAGGKLVGVTWGVRGWPGDQAATMVALADVRRVCRDVAERTGLFPKLAGEMSKPFESKLYGGPVEDPPPQRMPPPPAEVCPPTG